MTTATLFAKSMVRKAREVNRASRKTKAKIVDTIEFQVLMTLPFVVPFIVIYFSTSMRIY